MADPVSLTLAALSGADLCVSYGQRIVEKYKIYAEADTVVGDMILRLQHHWNVVDIGLDTLRNVSHVLDEKLQLHLNTIFQKLQVKLQEATIVLDGVIGKKEEDTKRILFDSVLRKKGDIKRIRLVSGVKKSLDRLLRELEEWQRKAFDPLWFLLACLPNLVIDQQLTDQKARKSQSVSKLRSLRGAIKPSSDSNQPSTSIFLPVSTTLREGNMPISHSSGEIGRENPTGKYVFLENLYVNRMGTNLEALTKSVRDFARVLSVVEPTIFGILACQGVIKFCDPTGKVIQQFQFVFRIPDTLQVRTPRSLRELLIIGSSYPLDERLRLATQLARSVLFVHTAHFVHKNIRPETIIIFQEKENTTNIGVPFLMGFNNFRPADGNTCLTGDSNWEKNLYRHPVRQGICLQESYRMQHDIYSLGVCLLEIGLWNSFVLPDPNNDGSFTPAPILNITQYLQMKRERMKALAIKGELLERAKSELPSKTGSRYTNVVVSCLSCLDETDNDFGHEKEFLDPDGILVGVRYVEKILGELEEISL